MTHQRSVVRGSNAHIAGILRDAALIQKSRQSMWGYKRASSAVFQLEDEIDTFVQPDGSLAKIPFVGPRSEAIILEVLRDGYSGYVERMIDESGSRDEIEQRRKLRGNFLSRAEVGVALDDRTLSGPRREDYHGDLQVHSTWSDGSQTIREFADGAIARGYTFGAVTDHSYGLRIARGVSMADVATQQREIDLINMSLRGTFRLIKGVEANIRPDGSVDLEAHELAQFELVLAAPHSGLRSPKDQTGRMLRAVETPGVHILAHPRGRMYNTRPGVSADWDRIFDVAREANVAIEIDGDPARQDFDHGIVKSAVAKGCIFALDSDAHAVDELANSEIAIAHARLAGVPVDRVVNCWGLDRLLSWLEERRARG